MSVKKGETVRIQGGIPPAVETKFSTGGRGGDKHLNHHRAASRLSQAKKGSRSSGEIKKKNRIRPSPIWPTKKEKKESRGR